MRDPLPLDAEQRIPRTIGRLPLSRAGANALSRCVGSRFRVWQGLDCRPQLIDQHSAVVHTHALFAGQSQSILDNLVCYWARTYTRKSSEEGLEQAFNSLQAQREACEAFIR